ncbi:MAG: hypothetical protein PHY93_03895 [Bacteriovorax sp.]|nr:hypothetical protein [Bacteriovorax sp.]
MAKKKVSTSTKNKSTDIKMELIGVPATPQKSEEIKYYLTRIMVNGMFTEKEKKDMDIKDLDEDFRE